MNYKNFFILFLGFNLLAMSGCNVVEVGKKIWGSSTQTLEEERKNAITKTFRCTFDECFDKVIELTNVPKKVTNEEKNNYLDLFQQNRRKMLIVVMGVPGAISTTEVGIFFVSVENNVTRLEFSSLSTPAKVKASDMVVAKFSKFFPEVKK